MEYAMEQLAVSHVLFAILPVTTSRKTLNPLVCTWLSLEGDLAARGYGLTVCPIDDGMPRQHQSDHRAHGAGTPPRPRADPPQNMGLARAQTPV
jgi:hypothetical protein